MKRVSFASFVAGMLSFSAMLLPAPARGEAPYDRIGPYVGGGFSYALQNFGLGKTEQAVSSAVSDFIGRNVAVGLGADDSPGFDIRGGYRFHPNFAIEGDFQYFTGFDANIDKISLNGQELPIPPAVNTKFGSIDTLAMTVNAKGYALTGRIQPYGLLGVGFMRASFDPNVEGATSQDDTTFALRFGAGVDFYVTPNIIVNLEASYLKPTSDYKFGEGDPGIGGDIIPIGAGVQFRF
jgi:opacity protein-like surface antigen